ncbi:potassium/sodium hyperpolarization-activated cyclic nucleotide-gated channel 1-like [Anticarsia gemmatalis]|uniref:potassium/sodium hyperpolarization-activated cyclic nucleotide-gated channel 1-like n=1 Tax=Anticarsia gemmatalis TaxID=129554 RepID=UPI003F75B678
MYGMDKHVCMLTTQPSLTMHPTGTICQKLVTKLRALSLPCSWHHGTVLFIRSLKRLRVERERHSYAIHPYSPIKYYWDVIHLCFMFAVFVYMPFQVFVTSPNCCDIFIFFTDGLSFLNMCSRFFTGYIPRENKVAVLEPKKIAIHYLKTHFLADFIGCLPLQLVRFKKSLEYPTHTAMYVFKLLRIWSLSEAWKNVVGQMQLSYIWYVAAKVTVMGIMFFHWMTYVHYQVPTLCYHFYPMTMEFARWLKRFHIHSTHFPKRKTLTEKYTTNLYLVCGLCIGAGYYTPLDQHIVPDFLLSSGMELVGLVFVTYAFTAMLRLTIYGQFASYLFKGKYKELEEDMEFMRLPWFLQRKINLFLSYKFNERYFNEEAIQSTMNEQLKHDINLHCCRWLVMNVPMFQDMPVALINSIVFNFNRTLFLPGEIIVKYGLPGSSIHLISSGTVAVMDGVNREVAHLRDGAFFGENALLHPGILRTATIIALEITEVYMLESKEFAACLQPYPHLKRKLDDASLSKHAALLQRMQRRHKRQHSAAH